MGVILLLAGDANDAKMPTESEWADLRRLLGGSGFETSAVPTTIPDGTEAVEMKFKQELPYGGAMIVYTLAVPKGDSAFVMSYVVIDEGGDDAGWAALMASVRHTGGGIPIWAMAAAGVFVLGLLVFMLRGGSNQPVGRVVIPDSGFRGPDALNPGPMGASRPAFGGQDPAPAATPGSPYSTPAANVPTPTPGARGGEPVPQIPGLRSTLPPSGRWGK